MNQNRDSFRLTLTPEQQEQVRQATNKHAEAIELSVQELEERISPAAYGWKPTL